MRAEPLHQPQAYHAEGPCWWPDWGGLRYVDMFAGDVLSLHQDGTVDRHPTGSTIAACIRPRRGGGAIVALERGFALAGRADLTDLAALEDLWSCSEVRFNEGGCDPSGAFYCGTMRYDREVGGADLYRFSPTDGATVAKRNLTISNGLGWSPDGTVAYHNDSGGKTIFIFDWSAASGLVDRRPWLTLPDSATGVPDGLCVDAEGGVWTAVNGAGEVHRYGPDGLLSEVIELPVTKPTACTFGGADLRTLFITTSREDLTDDQEPLAGAVFACTPGVTGLPALPFAG